jgi:hypothetical protein
MSLAEAAAVLGDGVAEAHVQARLRRGSLSGERAPNGTWRVSVAGVEAALGGAPACGGCGSRVTEMVIVKYPHHDPVEFALCAHHAVQTALAYRRQGHVLEVVTYPYQSEGWLQSRPNL